MDCAGECDGTAKVDPCGVCEGDDSTCTGCMDDTVCNFQSTATIDDRSQCVLAKQYHDCTGNCVQYNEREDVQQHSP